MHVVSEVVAAGYGDCSSRLSRRSQLDDVSATLNIAFDVVANEYVVGQFHNPGRLPYAIVFRLTFPIS